MVVGEGMMHRAADSEMAEQRKTWLYSGAHARSPSKCCPSCLHLPCGAQEVLDASRILNGSRLETVHGSRRQSARCRRCGSGVGGGTLLSTKKTARSNCRIWLLHPCRVFESPPRGPLHDAQCFRLPAAKCCQQGPHNLSSRFMWLANRAHCAFVAHNYAYREVLSIGTKSQSLTSQPNFPTAEMLGHCLSPPRECG